MNTTASLRLLLREALLISLATILPAQGVASPTHPPAEGRKNQPSTAPAISTQANDPLGAQLSKNRYTLGLEGGRLKGEGADFLLKEARSSQFFLIGEDHGFAELPQFTAALFRQIHPYGYRHLAIEAGPVTARILEKLAAAQNSEQAFAGFSRQNPFALPFYSWKEEAALLETVVKSPGMRAGSLWGLDQEFILSAKPHLQRLVELAPDAKSKMVVEEFYRNASTEFRRMVESKNPGVIFMASAREEDFGKLQAALRPKPGSEAAEILKEMKESWDIYVKQFGGRGYESNVQRAQLSKAHFMRYYDEALKREQSPPRVLFKFGANHTKRGRSYTDAYDLGNLTTELAAINNTKSFHLLVLGAEGTQNAYRPYSGNEADKAQKYDVVSVFKSFTTADVTPFVKFEAADKQWVVLDLRPLRPLLASRRLGKVDPGMAEMIWGYDAVLVIPEVHASTLFEWN